MRMVAARGHVPDAPSGPPRRRPGLSTGQGCQRASGAIPCDNRWVINQRDDDDLRDGSDLQGRFLTLDEVADTLRVEVSLVRELVEAYELPAIQVGGDGPWRVESDVLEQFIDDRYEAQRRTARLHDSDTDDFAELWGPRIPEDGGVSAAHDLGGAASTTENIDAFGNPSTVDDGIGDGVGRRPKLRAVDDDRN